MPAPYKSTVNTYTSNSELETAAIAATLAPRLKAPCLICLNGDLGMGKSVFARALIRTLSNAPALDVPSPTYTLVQNYDTASGSIYHYDLYRLQNSNELHELGWDDALYDGIVLVEWSARASDVLPAARIDIIITAAQNDAQTRTFIIDDKLRW